jgi:hypothetical protein
MKRTKERREEREKKGRVKIIWKGLSLSRLGYVISAFSLAKQLV